MNKYMKNEQRLLYFFDDASGNAELEDLQNQGWAITQISSVDSRSCWLLLEREAKNENQSSDNKNHKQSDVQYNFKGNDIITNGLGEEIRKNSY